MTTTTQPYPAATPVTAVDGDDRKADIKAIQKALTRTTDALAGYEKMVPKAEAEVAPILTKLRDLHEAHAGQLAAMITGHGGTPDVDGSLMSTVNEAVVSLRDLFDDIDDDALEHAVDGEKHVTRAFGDAMGELPEGPDRQALADMLAELEALLKEARVIAD